MSERLGIVARSARVTTWLVRVRSGEEQGYLAWHPLLGSCLAGPEHKEEAWHYGRREAHERAREIRAEGDPAVVVRWTRTLLPPKTANDRRGEP